FSRDGRSCGQPAAMWRRGQREAWLKIPDSEMESRAQGVPTLKRGNNTELHYPVLPRPPHPHLELSLQPSHRAPPHVHPELPRLDDELHALIVQAELSGRQLELHRARFAGLQGHPPEA